MKGSWILAISLALPAAAVAQPDEIDSPIVTGRTLTSLTISWTSPGNPAKPGVAALAYDLRYSMASPYDFESFTEWFSAATEASGEPRPSLPASPETMTLPGLAAGRPYFIAIKASDGALWSGISDFSFAYEATLAPPPDPITALVASPPSPTAVTLTWPWPAAFPGAAWSASSCWIACTTAGPLTDANFDGALGDPRFPSRRCITFSAPGSETTVSLAGLEPGTHYWLAIRSTNEAQNLNSPVSNNVEATTPALDRTPPDRINDLAVTPTTRSTELLTWHASGDDGNVGRATRYELRLSDVDPETDPEWWIHAWRFALHLSPPVTGPYGTLEKFSVNNPDFYVQPGKRLWFAIKAIDDENNESELSNIVTTDNTKKGPGPTQIQNLRGVEHVDLLPSATHEGELALHLGVALTWTAPTDLQDEMPLPASRYDLRRSTRDPSEFVSIDAWWADLQTVKIVPPRPGAPGSNESLLDPLAGPGLYYYAIRSIDSWENWSLISPSIRVAIIVDRNPPGTIATLAASKVLSTSVTLTWTAPRDDSTADGRADRYQMYCLRADDPDQVWGPGAAEVRNLPPPGLPGTIDSVKVTDLAPSTPYTIMIRSLDRFGNFSEFCTVVVLTNPADPAPPAAIEDLAPSLLQSTYVILDWSATGDDGRAGTATGYELRWSAEDPGSATAESWWTGATPILGSTPVRAILPAPSVAGTLESVRIDGLAPGTIYHFAIRAIDDDDKWNPIATPLAVATDPRDVIPPGAITTLRVVDITGTTVTLAWNAEGEDGPGSGRAADRYDLRYSIRGPASSGSIDAWWDQATPYAGGIAAPALPGMLQAVTLGDLEPNQAYFFALKSVDEAPNRSSLSNLVSVTTFPVGSQGDTQACSASGNGSGLLGAAAVLALLVARRKAPLVLGLVILAASGCKKGHDAAPLPLPLTLASISPNEGKVGTPIQVSGSGFGSAQGSGTLTIGGTTAAISLWSDTLIGAIVPAGAASGSALVTVGGLPSNAVEFTLLWTPENPANTAISVAAGDQAACQIVSDGSGGAIIAWEDHRSGSSYDLYAQRVNGSGAVQWTADGVAISTAASDQTACRLVSDGSGGAIIAWQDYRSGHYDIYAQRVNGAGLVQWTADGVAISTAANHQKACRLASDGSGGAIIAWEDFRNLSHYDIYAQRVNGAGVVQWSADGVAISTAADYQVTCRLVSDGSGGAIIAWEDFRSGTGGTTWDIYAQRVNGAGAVQWTANGVAISAAPGVQAACQLVSDGSGGAIIAWEDHRNGSNYDIYAQRVNGAGAGQWTADGLAISAAASDQAACQLVSDGSGGAIIAWGDHRSGSNDDLYAQRVNGAGVVQWTADGLAISTAAADQAGCQLVSDGSGGAVIAWEDHRNGANNDLYAQRVNGAGIGQWTADGVAISTAAGDQAVCQLGSDGSGGAILAWQDYRSGSTFDLFAQGISAEGTQ